MRQPKQRADAPAAAPVAAADPASGAAIVPFFDAHVHLNDESMQLELMDRFGAERAIVFWGRSSDNTSVADAAARHPRRLVAFASISPERAAYRVAWDRTDTRLLHHLDELLVSGRYRGIGEISAVHFPSPGFAETDFDPAGPMVGGILELARRYRVPVMLHVEVTRLKEFSAQLERFRDVAVIWAHGGYTPLFLARRLLEQHANLVYELSARTWRRHPRSPDYTILRDGHAVWPEWLALIEAMPDRFVIGTDATHRSRAVEEARLVGVQSVLRQLPPVARERVARGNLMRMLEPLP